MRVSIQNNNNKQTKNNSRFLFSTRNNDDDDVTPDELATVQSDFKPLSFGDTKRKESPHHDRYTTISFFEKCYI